MLLLPPGLVAVVVDVVVVVVELLLGQGVAIVGAERPNFASYLRLAPGGTLQQRQ